MQADVAIERISGHEGRARRQDSAGFGPRRHWRALACGLVVALGLSVSGARATEQFARQERKTCLHCHESPRGGRDRLNPTGTYYRSFRKLPGAGAMIHPKPAAGPAPSDAWHPERMPARAPLPNTRADRASERQLKARMARWTRALGAKSCYYCHAEKLPGATIQQLDEARRRYEVSIRHKELTGLINKSLGGPKVSCYTCHLGGQGPVAFPGELTP
jgi:hypothetical protein